MNARTTRTAVWSDTVWPVLAGCATAVGVIGVAVTYGPFGLVMIAIGMWALTTVTIYGATYEIDWRPGQCSRAGLVASVTIVDLVGTLILFPLAGSLVAAGLGATCPPATRRVGAWCRRHRPGRTSGPPADQLAVDRTFAEIATRLLRDA